MTLTHSDLRAMNAPFLSITILNYNYAHYLPQCLDSILAQTMRDFEIILINDTSTDDSLEVIEPYLADPRIRFVNHEKNKGFVYSLIEGCELSHGKYISVISADDYVLESTAFEAARRVVEANPDVVLCYSAWYEVDGKNQVIYERRSAEHDYVADGVDELRRLLHSSSILHSGTIIRRDAYHAVGGYDRSLRFAVDNNMWMLLATAGNVAYIDRHLYAYRSHSGNMSKSAESFWSTTEEMLKGIDDALARVSLAQMPDKEKQRCKARQRTLVTIATVDIFAGRYRRGWHGFLLAMRRHPRMTVLQPRTLVLVARTLLGARGFEAIRRIRGEHNNLSRRFFGGSASLII